VNKQVEALGKREYRPPSGGHERRLARVVDDVAHGGRAGNDRTAPRVDFPDPDSPAIPRTSPSEMSIDTSSQATTSPVGPA